MKTSQITILAGITTSLLVLPFFIATSGSQNKDAQAATGTMYYVDCTAGNDTNVGTSEQEAWQSLSKANAVSLNPGDSLLLKRDCSWNGSLQASWNGTEADPITIGAYSSGNDPIIQSNVDGTELVAITGSYLTIENIFAKGITFATDAACENTPVGYILGFSFKQGSHHNTLQHAKASGNYAGVYIQGEANPSHHNKILNNEFTSNTMMEPLDTSDPWNDAGAFGVLLWGDDNEIAYNTISNNYACSYDYGTDGAAVELYGGQRNFIHHNKSVNDESFTELGNSRTADNIYAYNSFFSNHDQGAFLVTRGAQDGDGPAWRTKAYNNTAYMTGPQSQGVVCYAGCSSDILSFRNNIIQAGWKDGYADAAFDEDYNLYGGTFQQFAAGIGSHSLVASPLFVNAALGDFHLQSASPAINAGTVLGYTSDLDGNSVPQGVAPDMGAYEYLFAATNTPVPSPTQGISPTNTPVPTATQTPTPTSTPTPIPPTPTQIPTATPTSVASNNLLSNSSFEGTLSPWNFWTRSGVTGTASVVTSQHILGNYAAQINITKSSSGSWNAQFRHDGLSLVAGKTYTVSFWAKASKNRPIDHVIQMASSPYTVQASKRFSVTTTWQKYSYTFQASGSYNNIFYGFNVAQATGNLWLDDVQLTSN